MGFIVYPAGGEIQRQIVRQTVFGIEIRGVLDEDDAGVGWGGVARTVWNVVEAKQKIGNELDRNQDHRNTAEITVAGGRVVRNPAIELGVNRSRELQALVEPIDDGGLQSHRR